jgi:hypothetical protein
MFFSLGLKDSPQSSKPFKPVFYWVSDKSSPINDPSLWISQTTKTLSPTIQDTRTEYPTLFRLCGTIISNAVPVIYNTSQFSTKKSLKKAALHTKYFTATLKL